MPCIFVAKRYQLLLPSSTRVDCSKETSSQIRADTRIYIIRVVAALQELVPVCITRTVILPENDMVFVVGIEIDFVVVWAVEIDVILVWDIGVDLISVWGSDLTWFYVGVRNDLV